MSGVVSAIAVEVLSALLISLLTAAVKRLTRQTA